MNRLGKAGTAVGVAVGVIAIGTFLKSAAWAVLDTRYDSGAVVDTKIGTAIAISETKLNTEMAAVRDELRDWRAEDNEMWIQFLDFKANRGEANDFDMTLLAAKLRQREELLKK